MIDMVRLASFPEPAFRTVQFSSYDHLSRLPGGPDWFANADGFGGESIPNFEKVLREPDENGVGEYLIAGAFFHRPYDSFPEMKKINTERFRKTVYQRDASYAPIPFATRLRVVWTGKVEDIHFLPVKPEDLRHLQLPENWHPASRFGARNSIFYSAEDLVANGKDTYLEAGRLLAGGNLLIWTPNIRQRMIKVQVNVVLRFFLLVLFFYGLVSLKKSQKVNPLLNWIFLIEFWILFFPLSF